MDEQCATVAVRFDEQREDGFLVAKVRDHCARRRRRRTPRR
jgi:hypothetical protein